MGCGVSKDSVAEHPTLLQSSKKRLVDKNKRDAKPGAGPSKPSSAVRAMRETNMHREPPALPSVYLENAPPSNAMKESPRASPLQRRTLPLVEFPISSSNCEHDKQLSTPAAVSNKQCFSLCNSNSNSNLNQGKSATLPVDNGPIAPPKRQKPANSPVLTHRASSCSPRQTKRATKGVKRELKAMEVPRRTGAWELKTVALKDIILPQTEADGLEKIVQAKAETFSADDIAAAVDALSQGTKVEFVAKANRTANTKNAKDLIYRLQDVETFKSKQSSRNDSCDSDQIANMMPWSNISSSPSSYMKELMDHLDQSTDSVHLPTTPRHWTSLLGDSDIENLDLDIENISLDDDNGDKHDQEEPGRTYSDESQDFAAEGVSARQSYA